MSSARRVPLSLTAAVTAALLFPAGGPASAATIKGKITGAKKATVNGVAANGQVVSKTVGAGGKFSLKVKRGAVRGASLQLISSAGKYLGPVVLLKEGRKAYTQLSGKSVDLGKIKVLKGYAIVAGGGLAGKLVDRSKASTTSKSGKPLGAGKLGVVATKSGGKSLRGAQSSAHEQGADPDRDGLVSAFDADDNGNLILDNQDPFNSSETGGVFSTIFTSLEGTVNVNAGNASTDAVNNLIRNSQNVIFYFDDGQFEGRSVTGASVNCFALSYCARGSGTAIISGVVESGPDLPRGQPWTSYTLDGSGYPSLERIAGRQASVMSIIPNATLSQIAPGDSYQVLFDTSGGPVTLARSLPPFFVTTPAVASFDSGAGASAITYPASSATPGSSEGNPVVMPSERLTLTMYRPQRMAIPGAEPGTFIDMGRLHYGVVLSSATQEFGCPGHYSSLSPTLTEGAATGDPSTSLFPLTDGAADAAPGASSTIGFTLDLGACMRASGMSTSGQTVNLNLTATGDMRPGGADRSVQMLAVKLPG